MRQSGGCGMGKSMETYKCSQNVNAWVAKLADAPDLGSGSVRSAGSTPVPGTFLNFYGSPASRFQGWVDVLGSGFGFVHGWRRGGDFIDLTDKWVSCVSVANKVLIRVLSLCSLEIRSSPRSFPSLISADAWACCTPGILARVAGPYPVLRAAWP